ncbi:MAG: hypothetical protein A4E65_03055 [Syntrophorhabdus sp. PtaU1.Bin153]|nr:MAG: hypothetical protein A4E65_03055 [Syntrophorhabdus sp. PtaU1.Bin153]
MTWGRSDSGIVALENLRRFIKDYDPQGYGLNGRLRSGKRLNQLICRLTESIEPARGFYLWGGYYDKLRWNNLYLGKAGYRRCPGLRKRITEELRDEKCFLWLGVLTREEILKKGAELYPNIWSLYRRVWENRHLKKAGASHIIWVATPELNGSLAANVQADLIETLHPTANTVSLMPPPDLQQYTHKIVAQFRMQIHANRPSRSNSTCILEQERHPEDKDIRQAKLLKPLLRLRYDSTNGQS